MAAKKNAKSSLVRVGRGWRATVSAGVYPDDHERKGERIQFRLTLATASDQPPEEKLARLLVMRDALVKAGRGLEAEHLLREAALHVEQPELFEAAFLVATIVESQAIAAPARGKWTTWAEVARGWTSGAIAREFPHKKRIAPPKTVTKENGIIDWLEPFIGEVPVDTFGVSHYNTAMANVPSRVKTDAARRHYHQVVMRVMRVALKTKLCRVWLLDEVEPVTIDKKKRPQFTCLFPVDLNRLLPSPKLDFRWRLLWGFMVWESPRIGKLAEIRWAHVETDGNGAVSMDSKSGEMLYWDLRPGTLEALLHYRKLEPKSKGPFDWLTPEWQAQAAKFIRRDLKKVGSDDDRLQVSDGRRRKLRAHDTRATFVVFAKIEGRSESWIMDRTGHTSSEMVQRYDRLARVSAGKGWAKLGRLDEALGLVAPDGPTPSGPGPMRPDGEVASEAINLAERHRTEPPPEPSAVSPGEGAHVCSEALRGALKRGAVTPAVTLPNPLSVGESDESEQVVESIETQPSKQGFRRQESNLDQRIQRPLIGNGSTQNADGSGHRDTPEGTGSDQLSRLAVTPRAVYAASLKRAMHDAIEAESMSDIGALASLFEKATAAAGGAQVVELALRRRGAM